MPREKTAQAQQQPLAGQQCPVGAELLTAETADAAGIVDVEARFGEGHGPGRTVLHADAAALAEGQIGGRAGGERLLQGIFQKSRQAEIDIGGLGRSKVA